MKRVSRTGRTHNAASEMKWASYQVPPVMCCYCGERVTLKAGHRGFFDEVLREGRTWHLRCDPARVRVVVERGET